MLRVVSPLLAGLLLAGCQASADDPAPQTRTPLTVLVAGDSLAGGFYASDVGHGFAELLYDDLAGEHEVTPVTVAVPGARALGVAIELEKGAAPEVDVVVLEAGANDVGESSARVFDRTYRRLLDAVAATSPDAEVVCLGPWGPPRASAPYERVLERLCRDHVYVRLSDLYAERRLHGPRGSRTELGARDGFHPNDAGHAAIAARVDDALGRLLHER